MNYLSLPGILISTASSITAFLLLLFIKKASNRNLVIIWIFFSSAAFLWGFGIFSLFISSKPENALFWSKFLNCAALFLPIFFFHFVSILLKIIKEKKREIFIYYIITFAIFLSAILFPNLFIPYVKHVKLWLFNNYCYYPQPGIIYHIYTGYFAFLILYGMYLFFKLKNDHRYSSIERNQIIYILLAFIIGFSGCGMTFLPIYGLNIAPLGIYIGPIYLLGIAYTIINYDVFLDIGFVAKKILSWSITFLLVFGLEVGFYFLFSFQHFHPVLIYILAFLNLIFAYLLIRFIVNKLNPTLLKDFEDRLKKLSSMGLEKGIFHTVQEFADTITKDIANVMNSKNVRFFSFNGETGLFDLLSQSSTSKKIDNEDYKKNLQILSSKIVEYLQQNDNQSIIKSTLKKDGKDKDLKDLLDKEKIEAVYPFFIGDKLMGFLTLGDSEKSYLYHKKEIEQLGYLLRVKEHIFANTYFLNLQKTIADMTQHIIDIDESSEFYHYLTSTTTRQFNIYNSIFYAYDKEKKAFVCRYKIGYGEEELPDIPETHPLLKVLNKTRNIITIEDFKIQNSKLKFDYIDDIKFFLENKVKSIVVSPLTSTNGIIGIMFFGPKRRDSEYHAYDLDFIKNISTISSIKLLGFMIKEEAEIDSLTKAFNRKSLSVRFEKAIKSAKADRKVVLFIFYDIDFFKKINDSKSHDFGDKVLEELASKIKTGSRSEDMLFRLGGEEFLFVVGPIEEKDVETIKKKFLNIVHNDLKTGKYTKDLTLSMSDVLFKANRDVNDPINNIINIRKTIFRQGDDGVYTVKNNGRNNIASGGIIEDANIGEIYKNTIQIIFDDGSQNEDLGHYFRNKELDVKYSHFNDAIDVFEKERPDAFLFVYNDKKKLSELKKILSEIKKRSMSAEIGIAVKSDLMKKDLKDFTSLMFFNMQEPKLIENWAKLLAKGLE